MPDNLELISPMPNDDLPNIGVAGEFFAGFMEFLKASLLTNGIDETHARDIVIKVVYELSQAFAGDTFYVTKKLSSLPDKWQCTLIYRPCHTMMWIKNMVYPVAIVLRSLNKSTLNASIVSN